MKKELEKEIVDKGRELDKLLSANAMLVVGAVEQVVGRNLTPKEKELIINSAKAFHMVSMLTAKSVL